MSNDKYNSGNNWGRNDNPGPQRETFNSGRNYHRSDNPGPRREAHNSGNNWHQSERAPSSGGFDYTPPSTSGYHPGPGRDRKRPSPSAANAVLGQEHTRNYSHRALRPSF